MDLYYDNNWIYYILSLVYRLKEIQATKKMLRFHAIFLLQQ